VLQPYTQRSEEEEVLLLSAHLSIAVILSISFIVLLWAAAYGFMIVH